MPPAGVFAAEAWARWHERFRIVPIPPLPRVRFPDGSLGPERDLFFGHYVGTSSSTPTRSIGGCPDNCAREWANPTAICCVRGRAVTIFCGMKTRFTEKQGQYLAFIYYYTKVNGRPPAEADMQRYFRVTPPSVHQMVLTIEANGFIERIPGQGRSIRLKIPREQLPDVE